MLAPWANQQIMGHQNVDWTLLYLLLTLSSVTLLYSKASVIVDVLTALIVYNICD